MLLARSAIENWTVENAAKRDAAVLADRQSNRQAVGYRGARIPTGVVEIGLPIAVDNAAGHHSGIVETSQGPQGEHRLFLEKDRLTGICGLDFQENRGSPAPLVA